LNREINYETQGFLKSTLLTSAAITFPGMSTGAKPIQRPKGKLLNAYYFRAHMYTMVPRQVREDLQWMADVGTNIVSIAVLEQDLFAAVENIEIICDEASKLGMDVWAVPSAGVACLPVRQRYPVYLLFKIMRHGERIKMDHMPVLLFPVESVAFFTRLHLNLCWNIIEDL
jgi:hypothetical protein